MNTFCNCGAPRSSRSGGAARLWVAITLILAACGDNGEIHDAETGPADGDSRDASIDAQVDGAVSLRAIARGPRYADLNETVQLDGSESTGAIEYQWNFGDGRTTEWSESPTAEVSWAEPGRYQVVLSVRGAQGMRTDSTPVTAVYPAAHTPKQSGTIARLSTGEIAALSTDANIVRLFDSAPPFAQTQSFDVCDHPRTLTEVARERDSWIAVACQGHAAVQLIRADGSEREEVVLPTASRPYGVVGTADTLYVSLQGLHRVATFALDDLSPAGTFDNVTDPRGLAVLPDGRVAATRWRSDDAHGEVIVLDEMAATKLELAFDPQSGSDTESGGVPSYLDQVLVSPTGRELTIPSTQANIGEGTFVSERPLNFDTTVRAIASFVELTDSGQWVEAFASRKLFDNRGLASSGVWNSRGDFLFVAMRGSRAVHRVDAFTRSEAGTILGTGLAPDGLALSRDDRFLFVNATLSRAVQVYDVSSFAAPPRPIAELPLVENEPLSAEILRGKKLFNDSADRRLAQDSYISCAHCHLDGDSDHRVWDFTDRGEGLRRTPPLFGRTRTGLLHWTANFDEIQDFENDIRAHFGGTGMLNDAQFEEHQDPLGRSKVGLSEDLDALAAYVHSLDFLPSPHRTSGELSAAAQRGADLFAAAQCDECHAGPLLSDSGRFEGTPLLHDVGTLNAGSGLRIGQPLTGLDTPTLHGLWHQRSFLHDGSATLREVITRNDGSHGNIVLEDDVDDLLAFLLAQDGP